MTLFLPVLVGHLGYRYLTVDVEIFRKSWLSELVWLLLVEDFEFANENKEQYVEDSFPLLFILL